MKCITAKQPKRKCGFAVESLRFTLENSAEECFPQGLRLQQYGNRDQSVMQVTVEAAQGAQSQRFFKFLLMGEVLFNLSSKVHHGQWTELKCMIVTDKPCFICDPALAALNDEK